jgi:hypothetical protein
VAARARASGAVGALTSDRSYRPALGHAEALARLQADAGTQFDPACVAAFAALDLHDRRAFAEPLPPPPARQPVLDAA